VLLAGQGNEALLKIMHDNNEKELSPKMQLRPLKMVMLRGNLPEKIYAHCLEANVNPRLTITSHSDSNGETVWYMGGKIAEEGAARSNDEQIKTAKKELHTVMPWLDFSQAQWACVDISRAEPFMDKGKRPDSSFLYQDENIITAWPTKLALAPKLASDVILQLKKDNVTASGLGTFPAFAMPKYAPLPWQEEVRWR